MRPEVAGVCHGLANWIIYQLGILLPTKVNHHYYVSVVQSTKPRTTFSWSPVRYQDRAGNIKRLVEKIIRTKYIPVQMEINNDKENIQQY